MQCPGRPARARNRSGSSRALPLRALFDFAILLLLSCASAVAAVPTTEELLDLSLEQLTNVVVTSVSRQRESLAGAAASVYVISAEDIRRSGATSIPEALRLAPNLQVARADNNQYAISARGFNNVLANKLLVMIDGRTVYSPLFSGVLWDAQDVMLEDVERIEVISGPSATMWGSNAVNGMINVITRPAGETQGVLASAGFGSRERGGALRYGGKLGEDGHYRVYGKTFDRSHTAFGNGTPIRDESERSQGGFRMDWAREGDSYTLQGDTYHGNIDQAPSARKLSGSNVLLRWRRSHSDGSGTTVQAYYDRTERNQPGAIVDDLDTYDLELQHARTVARAHHIVFGGGYRYSADRTQNSAAVALLPAERNLSWGNLFVQDDIALRHDLDLTLGAKIETNRYTGSEYLPTARLAWRYRPQRLVWAGVSRTVRAPSRLDREFFQPGTAPFLVNGGPGFVSETATVYELGYRAQPSSALSYSATLFHHDHRRLRGLSPTGSGLQFTNSIAGKTTGLEAWGSYRVTAAWRLAAGFTRMHQSLHPEAGAAVAGGVAALGNDASHWESLRSTLDITPRHQFDVALRHVGSLPSPAVPAYTALDARLGWKVNRKLELSLIGQNLLDPRHPEWGVPANRAEFQRAVFVRAIWQQ